MSASFYTTWGPVRGACRHRHNNYGTAQKCRQRDMHACKAGFGDNAYSDRVVYGIHPDKDLAYPASPGDGIKDREGEYNGRLISEVYPPWATRPATGGRS